VEIPEAPGSFLRFCEVLGRRSVTEFIYRYGDERAAQIFVGVSLSQGRAERDAIIKTIADAGFAVRDMTDNEMAKLHVRYMVGGQPRGLTDERLYRFRVSGASRARSNFCKPSAPVGTSACSTIAIMARIMGGSSPGSKCRPGTSRILRCT
jgi:threonine dehydratase